MDEKYFEKQFYRPHVQLDCRLTQYFVDNNLFEKYPMIIGDVGARGGGDIIWEIYKEQCILYGFEPDNQEYELLIKKNNESSKHSFKSIISNYALWNERQKKSLFIYAQKSASSFYEASNFYSRLPESEQMNLIDQVEVENVITLDEYSSQNSIEFDILKLDVQGAELAILQGGKYQLENNCKAVITEVEFVELYKEQPLFNDIDCFLKQRGFTLFDLDIRRWSRKKLSKNLHKVKFGQIIYADALYLKDPIENNTYRKLISKKDCLKLISIAELFSLPDFALELIDFSHEKGFVEASERNYYIDLINSNKIKKIRNRNIQI